MWLSPEEVAKIKETYTGKRIRLKHMPGDPDPIESGAEGLVEAVDDAGSLMVKWDNGRSLNLIPGIDQFEVI